MDKMAAKAKLSLSQLLFRRNNGSSNNAQSNNDANQNKMGVQTKTVVANFNGANVNVGNNGSSEFNVARHRRMSGGNCPSGGGGGGRQISFENNKQPPEIPKRISAQQQNKQQQQQVYQVQNQQQQTPHQKVQQQLQGILKKPGSEGGGLGGRTHRSSLHRSKSNPNPSNNPLKEVSWSCPTLEKRREVILNYFERIILENKQEQSGQKSNTTKPNIPCETGSGEPIYEEISDFPSSSPPSLSQNSPENNSNNRTGSLKPKLGPKKVRMNIPQDHHRQIADSQPIYDRVLCRSQSMLESSTSSSSSSGFYDVAPSTVASLSSSGSHHSLYENFRPSAYYATSTSSASSTDGDYGIVGGGGVYSNSGNNNNKTVTTRMAGRSHSFHDNYRNSGHYSFQQAPVAPALSSVDTDQLYAKVCKRKKLRVVNNENSADKAQVNQRTLVPQQSASPPKPPSCDDRQYHHHHLHHRHNHENELCVQVSCGNVVTMIPVPVMMPCTSVNSNVASSSFSTSCLSLSSSSDNNTDDMTITTSISSRNNHSSATNHNNNNNNGHFPYEAEKIIPDKTIAYIKCNKVDPGDSCPPSSAAARNRNNLSVIHLLAAYDPTKEVEEFIPTTPPATTFTAIIDSTDCAPKSISVPVRAGFGTKNPGSNHHNNQENRENGHQRQEPIMLTNCSFGYDNSAFQPDEFEEENDSVADERNNNQPSKMNLRRSSSFSSAATTISLSNSKDISSTAKTASGTVNSSAASSSGADEEDEEEDEESNGCCSSATSDSDTDEEEHQAKKYSFTSCNGNGRGGLKKGSGGNRVKRITFQDDVTITEAPPSSSELPVVNCQKAIEQDLLLLTTSEESEDDEELCEHKSLIEMNRPADILDEVGNEKGGMSLMDDEDRGFDSFLEESENSGGSKGDSPSFSSENMRNQRTFSQMTKNVPQAQLKKKAASVLDLINSEISDLHMRELELKKLHSPPPQTGGELEKEKDEREMMNDGSGEEEFEEGSSGEDDFSDSAIEYDGFTTNGSHSSGQVSPSENLNEMISQHQEELRKQRKQSGEENRKQVGNEEEDEEEEEEAEDEVDYNKRGIKEVKVRPLEEEEDRSIKFVPTDETPIEREIRLTREREEEFRRKNGIYLAICPPAPVSSAGQKMGGSPPVTKPRDVSNRPETQGKPEMPLIPGAPSKDVQLEMATARFKKEIEESMQREKELIREARLKKGENVEEINEVSSQEDEANVGQVTAAEPMTPTPPQQPQQPTPPQAPVTPAAPVAAESQSQLRKPTIAKLSIAKLPAARFFSPPAFNANKPSRITPVVSPIISKGNLGFSYPSGNNGNAAGGSLPVGVGRPTISPFEKYILQTSMNYMANKQAGQATSENNAETEKSPVVPPKEAALAAVVNKSLQFNIPEDPLRIIQKPSTGEESDEGAKEDEEEKRKRRYIPAQDKIHQEIQELAMREKELNRTRAKWKSTLDLPEAMKEAEEEKEPLRRTTSTTQSSLSLNTTANSTSTEAGTTITTANNDTNNSFDDGESDKLNFTNVTSEDVKQITRVKAPARRRHSLLINQWEERIRQQQQQNGKK